MRPVLVIAMVLSASTARGAVIDVSVTDDVRALLAAAEPGDEFVLAAGTYDLGATRTAISVGGAGVIVRPATGGRAVLSRSDSALAVLVVENSTNVTLRGLELVGGGRGVDIVFSDAVHVEGCVIHGASGDGVGATTGNGTLAQNAYVGIEVRDNVISDVGGDGIALVGDTSSAVIERNAVWRVGGVGVRVSRGVIARNNVVVGAGDVGLATESVGVVVAGVRIVNNTLLGNDGLRLGQPQSDVVVANNAIYAAGIALHVVGNANAVTFAGNVGSGEQSGVTDALIAGGELGQAFVDATLDGSKVDVRPVLGSPLIAAGVAELQPVDDFTGRPRGDSHDAGAYVFVAGGNGGSDPEGGGSAGPSPPGSSGTVPGPAKSEEGCAASAPWWPVLAALALSWRRR